MNSFFTTFHFAALILLSSLGLAAQCTYVANSNPMTFTGNCPPAPGTTLIFPNNSNPPSSVSVPFTDLRGVTIQLGQNVNLTFDGGILSNASTRFTFPSGGNNVVITGLGTFSAGAGNNPNGLIAYNNSLASCTGTCTLGQPMVLPVKLTYFSAIPNGKTVILKWETASESENRHFIVERKTETSDWTALTTISGLGTSTTFAHYDFTDVRPVSGLAYYRLVQEDFDGTVSFSDVQTVRFSGPATGVYPNPANNEINFSGEATAQIFSLSGRNVTSITRTRSAHDGRVSVDVTNLPNGIYMVKTATGTWRFVKL